ncbi:MAG: cell division protein SepF [Syntrophomonadaceae bacterium]|jgi:cell division inhibitor SepF
MGVINKMWSWLGLENEEAEQEQPYTVSENLSESHKQTANIVSIHSNKTMKVVVCEPDSFDEVQVMADHLKNRKQLIINFENTQPEEARRIIDFISGTTYALEGNSQQLGKNIFVFAPNNVEISKDHHTLARKSGFLNSFGGEH